MSNQKRLNKTRDKNAATKAEIERLRQANRDLKNRKGPTKDIGHYHDEVGLYIKQVLDPFTNYGATLPDVHGYPTSLFSCTTAFTLSSDANGRLAFMVRDGLWHHIASSSIVPTIGTTNMAYATGWYYTDAAHWGHVPEHAAIIGAYSQYRPVAMGVRIVPSAAPTSMSGRLAVGLYPPGEGVPSQIGADMQKKITYDDFAQYQEAITVSAIQGATVVWKPLTPNVEFRPTKPIFYDLDSDTFLPLVTGTDPVSWDLDPQACTAMQGLGHWTDVAIPTIGGLSGLSNAALRMMMGTLPQQSPMVMMLGEGLPASVECFTGEIVIRYEGIPDNRGFSPVQSLPRPSRPDSMHKAVSSLSNVKTSHAGGSMATHQDWSTKVISGITKAAGTIGKVAHTAGEVYTVVRPLVDAASAFVEVI